MDPEVTQLLTEYARESIEVSDYQETKMEF